MQCEHCEGGSKVPPDVRTTELKVTMGEPCVIQWCPHCTACVTAHPLSRTAASTPGWRSLFEAAQVRHAKRVLAKEFGDMMGRYCGRRGGNCQCRSVDECPN